MRLHSTPAVLLLIGAATLATPPANAEEAPRQITVTGAAEVLAPPDLATITAGAQTQATTAAQALEGNSTLMTEIFAELEGLGVARADLQTSQLSLDPVWEQPADGQSTPPKIVGYQASNMVTIKLREISTLGSVIDALGGAGANRIFGVSFEVEDPRPLLDQARTQAMADARAKAELLTKAAGVTLGPVLTIHDTPAMGSLGPLRAKADMAMATPVAEGTVTLGADVEVVFGLE
ncbi:MAG: SIMPL domain-containing protein [Amaricoccus sp.]|uniref:SIMPL domain-containing protein n=1 Tax=Amaricoccus sp. TaxID=1872485 RepID=UPI003314BF8C